MATAKQPHGAEPVEQAEVPEAREPQPVNVKQLVSHGAELFALTEAGEVWRRLMDPRDFNSGPGWTQKYLWQKIDVPHT